MYLVTTFEQYYITLLSFHFLFRECQHDLSDITALEKDFVIECLVAFHQGRQINQL